VSYRTCPSNLIAALKLASKKMDLHLKTEEHAILDLSAPAEATQLQKHCGNEGLLGE
jgi:hypothetical protein